VYHINYENKKYEGIIVTNGFQKYFENVFGHKNDKAELNTKNQNELSQLLCSDENTSQLTARVSHGEVRTAVRSLKTGKSPGLDRIFNEHIIYGGESAIHLFVTYTIPYSDPNIDHTNCKHYYFTIQRQGQRKSGAK